MPFVVLRLVESSVEFKKQEEVYAVSAGLRGIYVLYKQKPNRKFEVLYVGMARFGTKGIRDRLIIHKRSKRKGKLWTHFSAFKVWDNITDEEVEQLEGLFRHIYRKDPKANGL